MARRVLYETNYTFTPTTRTLVINRYIPRERLILITNVKTGVPLYNFSDPRLTANTYVANSSVGTSGGQGLTTITFNYNTTTMTSTDPLQIMIDEPSEMMAPNETLMDPVGKLRVSTPQSLIDTDFEYGLQPTKWEAIQINNNRASAFTTFNSPIANVTVFSTTNGSRVVTVNTSSVAVANGSTVYVQGTTDPARADGYFITDGFTANGFTYQMKTPATSTGSILQANGTLIFVAGIFSGANLAVSAITNSGNLVTVNTTGPHGMSLGNSLLVRNYTAATANAPNGTWNIVSTPAANQFSFLSANIASGALTSGVIMARPEGAFYHRAFDGGVQYNTGSVFHGNISARQTRRYFRYQSGKGIQMSTNVLLKPQYNVDQISASANTVTVRTKLPHNLTIGIPVTVSGCTPVDYNISTTVAAVIDPYQFTYTAPTQPAALTAGIPSFSVTSWSGASVRVGMFDLQNGFFLEFDGVNIYAVRRNSTTQMSGSVAVTQSNNAVTGTNTYFPLQANPGDHVVIRGTTYKISQITSNTAMTIVPEYRGATYSNATLTKITEVKVAQANWNIDKMDGTGPSGYLIDSSKTQMLYMDYSWYGAGAIRFGFKDIKGEVVYCHRFVNNNSLTEAYLRSGNLPARFETNNISPYTSLTATINATSTGPISVADTTFFASNGTIVVSDLTGGIEYINYTGKTANTFTGLTRGLASNLAIIYTSTTNSPVITGAGLTAAQVQPGMFVVAPGFPDGTYVQSIVTGVSATLSAAANAVYTTNTAQFYAMGAVTNTHTYSLTAPISVYAHAPTFSPLISHWGTSVIMDGGFDDDKSFIFTAGMTANVSVGQSNTNAIMSLRVAPAVDTGQTGTLGNKEIVNRMQLQPRAIGLRSDGNMLVQLYLNATVSGSQSWAQPNNNPSSLAQISFHGSGTTISGGEAIYAFYTDSSGAGTYGSTTIDLNQIRDIGNSIQGGGLNNFANSSGQQYPDGPDILTVVVTNLETGAARNATARLSWTEAQA